MRHSRVSALVSLAALLTAGAGCSVSVAPVVSPDPTVACPGGVLAWRLEIADQRADRRDTEKVVTAIRESIAKSLPGCRWVDSDAPSIAIEIHRFSVVRQDEAWQAYAEWSVLARDRNGRTLTEFQADSDVQRPNYRGVDNEKAAIQQAIGEAMQRTLAGLRSVPSAG
ncbi:MAG: hypothetical protein ABI592_10115 [Acidobacteriota bacterium]